MNNIIIGIILIAFGIIMGIFTFAAGFKVEKQFKCKACGKKNNTIDKKCEYCGKVMSKPKFVFRSLYTKKLNGKNKDGIHDIKVLNKNVTLEVLINIGITIIGLALLMVSK